MKTSFFDIDDTLTTTLSGEAFKQNPDDIKVMDGVSKGLDYYQDWLKIGISNQGGCTAIDKNTGKPYKAVGDAIAEMQNTLKLLPQLKCIYFCLDFKGDTAIKVDKETDGIFIHRTDTQYQSLNLSSFRKPGHGLITLAQAQYEVDLGKSWFIGDRREDEECSINGRVKFLWSDLWRERFKTGELNPALQLNNDKLRFLYNV